MSLDREQVRRDIRGFATRDEVAAHCLALLAELEQAERERDVARRGMKAVSKAKPDVEARFARVPALVEALKDIGMNSPQGRTAEWACRRASAALTEWERE